MIGSSYENQIASVCLEALTVRSISNVKFNGGAALPHLSLEPTSSINLWILEPEPYVQPSGAESGGRPEPTLVRASARCYTPSIVELRDLRLHR